MRVRDLIDRLNDTKKYVNSVILEREAEVDSAFLGVISRNSVLYVGDVGAAKTQLIEEIADMCGLTLFNTLMSQSTKPEQIFGPADVPALAKGVQRRKIDGYAPTAQMLFLDEIFKANSVVLNPLLWLLNEHKFRNDDEGIIHCPLVATFAASNEIPQDEESRPIYDRFLLRHKVQYIKSQANMHKLLQMAMGRFEVKKPEPLGLKTINLLRKAASLVDVPGEVWETMIHTRNQVQRATGIEISDRRMGRAVRLVQAHALMNYRKEAEVADIDVLANLFWDNPDHIRKVRSIVVARSGQVKGDLMSYIELAESVYDKSIKTGGVSAGLKKLRDIIKVTRALQSQSGKAIHRQVVNYARQLKDMVQQRKTFDLTVLQDAKGKDWFKLSEQSASVWTADQLRSVGFRWRRSLGYWWISGAGKASRKQVTARIISKLNVQPTFHQLGE